jgi:O-antigen/teichoic acid export membrane protein
VTVIRQANRLILNTFATYGRMLLTIGLGLATIRLLFQALGETGYGVFTATNATGAMLAVLQASLVTSAQRNLAFDLGQGNLEQQRRTFSTTLALFALSAVGVMGVSIAVGPGLLSLLTIPDDLRSAAFWVYCLSILNIVLTVSVTPYNAVLAARQEILWVTVSQVLTRVLLLAAVLPLFTIDASGDRLAFYAAAQVLVTVVGGLVPWLASRRYPEARFSFSRVLRRDMRRIGSFAGWTMFERLATTFREQGSVAVINAFFGPSVNAAYAIAVQVAGYVVSLPSALSNVIAPALTTRRSQGDAIWSERLRWVGSRYAVYMSMLLLVPIALEIDTILNLWIPNHPPLAASFCILVMLARLAGMLSWGDGMAAQAVGRIRHLSLALSLPMLIAFGLVTLAYRFGWSAEPLLMPAVMLVMTLIVSLYRPIVVSRLTSTPPQAYVRNVLIKLAVAIVPAAALAWGVHALLDAGIARVLIVTVVYGLAQIACIWFVGSDAWEREHVIRVVNSHRVRKLLHRTKA